MPKAIRFDELGGPEVLNLVDEDMPRAGSEEAVVRMSQAGINRAELQFAMGAYLQSPKLPNAPMGVEGSGIVEQINCEGAEIEVGDRVAISPAFDFDRYGVLAEYARVPVSSLIPVPDEMELSTAAAVWMAYGTAYGMLVTRGGLKNGSDALVVITGASSSVGVAALQIAKDLGARIIATTRSSDKVEQLKSAGADFVVATDDEDLTEAILKISEGKGFDLACDSVAGPFIAKLAAAASAEARIVCMGLQSGEVPDLPIFEMLGRGLSISGFHLRFGLLEIEDRRKEMVEHVTERLLDGRYVPQIARIFELNNVQEAYEFMASNKQFGKILISVAAESH